MSTTRYIEVDSTYRDRERWPSPALFEIPISQSGRKGRDDALDPVSKAQPVYCWKSNQFDKLAPSGKLTITVASPLPNDPVAYSNTSDAFFFTAPAGTLQRVTNYYQKQLQITQQ